MVSKMIKINDPICISIPVNENGEKMVNLLDLDRIFLLLDTKVHSESISGNSENPFARLSVKEMLGNALVTLPAQYGMVLIESYRTYDFQKQLFDSKVNYLIAQRQISNKDAEIEASRFVSNPDIYSPHVTGGAIDIGLIHLDSKELVDMGNNFIYDESAQIDFLNLTTTQIENREFLIKIMTEAGFVNYPFEWWHWSYGDKYWAMVKGEPSAFYDSLQEVGS